MNRNRETLPQIFREAKKILKLYNEEGGELRRLVYEGKYPNYGRLLALLSNVVNHRVAIQRALKVSKILEENPKFDPLVAEILASQILYNENGLNGTAKPIIIIKEYEKQLKEGAEHHLNNSVKLVEDTKSEISLPRWARINTLLASANDVHSQLAKEGCHLKKYDMKKTSYREFLDMVLSLDKFSYMVDYQMKDVLVFPEKTKFFDAALYMENKLILQDKASCIPVYVMGLSPGDCVMDASAAPGNKTNQIGCCLQNEGKIIAVDNNEKRFKTLQKLSEKRGLTCATFMNWDFTALNPEDFKHVRYILVDPSCTLSGTQRDPRKYDSVRLKNVCAFQFSMLFHALSFPSVNVVVYSTCSINVEENERIVQEALEKYPNFYLENLGDLLPGWMHFGIQEEFSEARKCLRTDSTVDWCQGFFVAKFVRRDGDIDAQKSLPEKGALGGSTAAEGEKKRKKRAKPKRSERRSAEEGLMAGEGQAKRQKSEREGDRDALNETQENISLPEKDALDDGATAEGDKMKKRKKRTKSKQS